MNKSSDIKDLAKSLSLAQGEFRGAVKDSSNQYFKSKYADLESVWEAVRAPLSKHGLSVAQTTDFDVECGTMIVTTLMHSSGQWIEGRLPIVAAKQDPQGAGSAITYARRYALAAILGVVQVDDDAESAMGRNNSQHTITNVTSSLGKEKAVSGVSSEGENPQCCGQPMRVSQYNHNQLYCIKCRSKQNIAA